MNQELEPLLAHHFGHSTLRPGQHEAVAAFCAQRDTLVLLSTGAGKSLCYQLPALWRRAQGQGPTVVVSPLIALMDDQVAALQARGIAAAAMHSQQDELVQRTVFARLVTGQLDILYISPERAALPAFRQRLKQARVAALAIDEAHCISQWGHDFRPDYLRLAELRAFLQVPLMALTATATPRVVAEMVERLGLQTPVVVRGGIRRANLHFAVRQLSTDAQRLPALAQCLESHGFVGKGSKQPGRALIYCATRKKVERVAAALTELGVPAGMYHAGRTEAARRRAQRNYLSGKAPVLVATNAFGMGIDQADVRVVVHYQAPGSLEAYFQEAGRAGRDGLPAHCVLFFGRGDLVTQRRLQSRGSKTGNVGPLLDAIETYAQQVQCRQQLLERYFGVEDGASCARCDACVDGVTVAAAVAVAKPKPRGDDASPLSPPHLDIIVAAVGQLRRPAGKGAIAKALLGSRAKTLRRPGLLDIPQHGALKGQSEASVQAAIEALLQAGRLSRKGRKYPTVWLPDRPVRTATKAGSRPKKPQLGPLRQALERYTRKTARSLGWKAYMVLTRGVMAEIEAHRPRSLGALEALRGMGPAKVERFGVDILEMIARH